MLKGRLTTFIFISLLLHLVIVLLFSTIKINTPKPKAIEKKAIKSYLFAPAPKKITPIVKPIIETIITPKFTPQVQNKIEQEIKNNLPQKTLAKPAIEKSAKDKLSISEKKIKNDNNTRQQTPPVPVNTVVNNSNFSAVGALTKLKNSIQQKMMDKEFSKYRQFKSPSVMHGQPTLAPHSNALLTEDEKTKQNTTILSSSVAITKHENGMCSITQDLSNVGMDGHQATSYFSCGESAFDKAFREHMEKVKAKTSSNYKR